MSEGENLHLLTNKPVSKFSQTHLSTNYLLFCLPSDWIFQKDVKISNSFTSTVILLLNSMIGSGILVQAYVFYSAGIDFAIIEYFLIGIMTYVGVDLLIRSSDHTNIFNYSDLSVHSFGWMGKLSIDLSIFIGNFGALLSYILIIGSLIESIFTAYSFPIDWYTNVAFVTTTSVSIFVLPFCLIRNFGHLAIISYLSIIAIGGTMLLVIIGGTLQSSSHNSDKLRYLSLSGSFHTIGSVVFAFGYSTAVFHAYQSLNEKEKTTKTFSRIAMVTTSVGVSMCFLTGIVGYLSFRDQTQTNILENFSGVSGLIAKLIVIIHLILYIPGDFVVMRVSFLNLFLKKWFFPPSSSPSISSSFSSSFSSSDRDYSIQPERMNGKNNNNNNQYQEEDESYQPFSRSSPKDQQKKPDNNNKNNTHDNNDNIMNDNNNPIVSLDDSLSASLQLSDLSSCSYLSLTIGMVACVVLLACLLQLYASDSDLLAIVLDLTGGIAGATTNFIMPACIALRCLPRDEKEGREWMEECNREYEQRKRRRSSMESNKKQHHDLHNHQYSTNSLNKYDEDHSTLLYEKKGQKKKHSQTREENEHQIKKQIEIEEVQTEEDVEGGRSHYYPRKRGVKSEMSGPLSEEDLVDYLGQWRRLRGRAWALLVLGSIIPLLVIVSIFV